MEELKVKFDALSDDEKIDFMKMNMTSMCDMFIQNSQKIMADMMPFCSKMMKECKMDMSGMMSMMMNK